MNSTFDDLQSWVGRRDEAEDVVSRRLMDQFAATLTPHLVGAEEGLAPALIHWCLAPPALTVSELRSDGHPANGGLIPPIAPPRRMWASSAVEFHDPLKVGDRVRRVSTVSRVEEKDGRTGRLLFVDVTQELATERGPAVSEVQSVVYRGAGGGAAVAPEPAVGGQDGEPLHFDAVSLFRYSAITFNGHRIHYDLPYATEVEGYEGLVVHGPLQATHLAHAAARRLGRHLASFRFRGVAPLIAGEDAHMRFAREAGGIRCCMCNAAGKMTMEAFAS